MLTALFSTLMSSILPLILQFILGTFFGDTGTN